MSCYLLVICNRPKSKSVGIGLMLCSRVCGLKERFFLYCLRETKNNKKKVYPETKNALAENKVEAKRASENKISGQELKLLIEKTVKESQTKRGN